MKLHFAVRHIIQGPVLAFSMHLPQMGFEVYNHWWELWTARMVIDVEENVYDCMPLLFCPKDILRVLKENVVEC